MISKAPNLFSGIFQGICQKKYPGNETPSCEGKKFWGLSFFLFRHFLRCCKNAKINCHLDFQVLFRPVAMANPDFALIAELSLKSFGFTESQVLSKKLASMVELCDGLLSSQPHYEFGLRLQKRFFGLVTYFTANVSDSVTKARFFIQFNSILLPSFKIKWQVLM